MLRRLSTGLLALAILATAISLLSPKPVYALFENSKSDACSGINLNTSNACANDNTSSLDSIIGNVIQILSVIVGVAAVIMIIVGGFKYIVSTGDSNAINSAKNTIIYALVGLAIAALAETLVHFVLFKAIGKS